VAARDGLGGRAALGLAAVAAGTALAVGLATYALWSSEDTFAGGLLTAGDLDMTTGQLTWQQITPGAPEPQSGVLVDGSPDFFSMPGDVLQIVQPVTTSLRGDNLHAGFSVDFADPAAGSEAVDAGGVALSFHVEDGDGNHVAPASGEAPLGQVLAIPGLDAGDEGRTDDWRVVIRVDVLGDYRWEAEDPTASPVSWAVSSLVVRFDQIRDSGDGMSGGDAG
jgi:alternate signal-mediated exported protein